MRDTYGHCHAVVLFVGAAAAEESDDEDDDAHHDEQDRRSAKLAPEEINIRAEPRLDHGSGYDQAQPSQLQRRIRKHSQTFGISIMSAAICIWKGLRIWSIEIVTWQL